MKRLKRFAGFQQFDALFVVLGAQRDGNQRLRFAAGEDSEPCVRGRTPASPQICADLVERAAIGTAPRLEHLVAEDALFEKFEEPCRPSCFLAFGGSVAGFFHDRSITLAAPRRRVRSSRASRTSSCSARRSVRRGSFCRNRGEQGLIDFRRREVFLGLAAAATICFRTAMIFWQDSMADTPARRGLPLRRPAARRLRPSRCPRSLPATIMLSFDARVSV